MKGDDDVPAAAVSRLDDEVLGWQFKAIPPSADGRTVREFLAGGPGLAEFPTPLLTLDGRTGARGPVTEVVLRSGAYVIHDDGYYRSITPANRTAGPVLTSAMHAWARVVSHPEPGLALLDAGRRDLPFDQGLPEPQVRVRPDGTTSPLLGAAVSRLNDQHAFLQLAGPDDVEIGDVVRLGLSHPCTAMDKWTLIPVLGDAADAQPQVVGLVRTYF